MTKFARLLRLGDLIKKRRERAGLTLQTLADQATLTVQWLRDLESGEQTARLLRLFAHPAMAGLLEELRDALIALRDGRGSSGHHGHNGHRK
jgi:transcriptional regulator with XRE-family HTH domain